MMQDHLYLDYAASAPLRPEAHTLLTEFCAQGAASANPNSLHADGVRARNLLEQARRDLATALDPNTRATDILFTSGGTESDNLAVLGLAQAMVQRNPKRNTVLLSAIEHDAVYNLQQPLKAQGFEVGLIPVDANGLVSPATLSEMLTPSVGLVSIMWANNETGAIQPISKLSALAHEADALFHTDAVQAFTHTKISLDTVDALSMSAHKIGAPSGVGALYLSSRVPCKSQLFGGGQEKGLRSGTQNVLGAAVFSRLALMLMNQFDTLEKQTQQLRTAFLEVALQNPRIHEILSPEAPVLPGIIALWVEEAQKEELLLNLDAHSISVSSGSACSAHSAKASRVLQAMKRPVQVLDSALRISFDERVSREEIIAAARTFTELL